MKLSVDPLEPSIHVGLQELVEQSSLEEIMTSLHNLFDVPLRVFDINGTLLVENTSTNKACQYLNTMGNTRSRCTTIRSKTKAAIPPPHNDEPTYIDCFCGLRYAITPLIFQTETVGKLIIGPYLPNELKHVPAQLEEIAPRLDLTQLKEKMTTVRHLGVSKVLKLINAINTMVDSLLSSAHVAYVTNQMHIATIRESYRELTEKNRKLEEMVEERKEFDRRKSNFLAMVSHELRTPLTSIIGYSDMLSEGIAGDLRDEQKQFVSTIKAKGDELLNMISSILDFSLIDTGRLSLQPVPSNIGLLLEEALAENIGAAKRRGVHLSIEPVHDLPLIKIDPSKIITAIRHLVDNAIKFSPPGGVVKVSAVTVTSNQEDSNEDGVGFVLMVAPDMLEICIEDFGVGISDHDQSEIFAPFTQIDESSTREHGGAGLGLAIVKHYIEAHGGRIALSSSPGEGSKFTIRIPIVS